ncbi:MAG: hypothetical protein IT389_12820 [Nitrospira sp.]|nr:hypothetical protein [Nitrospira sp.]
MSNTIIARRFFILSVLLFCIVPNLAVAQSRAGAGKADPCALLTRELVEKVNAVTKQAIDVTGPKELPLGTSGTACEWGDVVLQIDPWPPARLEEMRKKDGKSWEAIPGVGDAAYLHNIKDMMAELFVRTGSRTFAVLLTIPVGSTTAAFKPTLVAVANAIVPKLR